MKRKTVKIHYDPDADVLSFFVGGGKLHDVAEMWPLLIYLDKKNKPIYLEIVGASKVIQKITAAASQKKMAA